jgi:CubicO group peptidase (beta-lactamase class C family)
MPTNLTLTRLGAGLVLLLATLSLAPAATSATPAQDATPERVAAALPRLDDLAQQTLERTGVPGMAIAVVYRDEVVYVKGFGVRETGTEARVDADTVFQLASVSKPVASTVIAALVGDERFSWDDPIVAHDPTCTSRG